VSAQSGPVNATIETGLKMSGCRPGDDNGFDPLLMVSSLYSLPEICVTAKQN